MVGVVLAAVVALFALNAVLSINAIGRPREPITSGMATVVVVADAVLIVAVMWLAS